MSIKLVLCEVNRSFRGVHQIDDEVSQTYVQAAVKLVKKQCLAMFDNIEQVQQDTEKFYGSV